MKLLELIKDLDVVETVGNFNVDISEIKNYSNLVSKGDLFICLKGLNYDGHEYISQVESYGGVAVIAERKTDTFLTQIIVKDTRIAMSVIARAFYGKIDKKLKLIGVVGTNGKTSVCHLIRSIFEKNGVKCGVIGTLGTYYGDKYLEPSLTTPDPLDLFKIFSDMYSDGVQVVVMEVSAHAINLKKVYGLQFEVGVFTNFSRDHLDYFTDMESYRETKLSFFKNNLCRYVVSNSDDKLGREISNYNKNSVTYGIDEPSDVFAIDLKNSNDGISFVMNLFDCVFNLRLNLVGDFNVYNCLAASTACALYGVDPNKVANALVDIKCVSGRLEKVYDGDFKVYVDYAHTPDGLEKSIKAIKDVCNGMVICVFGCGGNRDKGKRSEMGKISGEFADFTIITSDNPRFEEPLDIMYEIEKGVREKSKRYVMVQDRKQAIEYAVNMTDSDDCVLICGKGSENYQEILGVKHLYNDKEVVEKIIGARK